MLLRLLRRLWAGALLLLALAGFLLWPREVAVPPTLVTPGEPLVARRLVNALASADAETVLVLAGHLVPESQHEQVRQDATQQRALGWLHRVRLAGCVVRWDSRTECAYLVERWPVGSGVRQYVRWWVAVDPDGKVAEVE